MKRKFFCLLTAVMMISCNSNKIKIGDQATFDSTDLTNNFYDNTETLPLPPAELIIEGETANPGKVNFTSLKKRSVIVKEALLGEHAGNKFTGAFRYDGYSLFDILERTVIKKANAGEFNPIIDLFIEVANDTGDKVVFSWGEIFYPNNLHKIIIATDVARIVPSKTNDLWTLPLSSKIVASADLITERNISNPSKITIRSYPISYRITRDMSPMYSDKIKLMEGERVLGDLKAIPDSVRNLTYNTVFYGRGRGIHSTSPFTGPMLKDVLKAYYPVNRENLRSGIFSIAGADGYRCAVSFSELFNRNDQEEFLLIRTGAGEDGGMFRIFASCDFFSDRAVKSVSEIQLNY